MRWSFRSLGGSRNGFLIVLLALFALLVLPIGGAAALQAPLIALYSGEQCQGIPVERISSGGCLSSLRLACRGDQLLWSRCTDGLECGECTDPQPLGLGSGTCF